MVQYELTTALLFNHMLAFIKHFSSDSEHYRNPYKQLTFGLQSAVFSL